MYEEIIRTEINSTTLVVLRDTRKKDSPKSKNYLAVYSHHIPEDETYKTLPLRTFMQAYRMFFNMKRALKNGTKIEIK